MTDTKKPTLSEIRAQTEAARKGGFAGPAIPYLLDLVSRMGKTLNWFVHLAHGVGKAGNEPEQREEEAAADKASALLEELKQ